MAQLYHSKNFDDIFPLLGMAQGKIDQTVFNHYSVFFVIISCIQQVAAPCLA